ncbi:hematopoietic death receptor isoform 1-T1 [Aulostomus maculatus]
MTSFNRCMVLSVIILPFTSLALPPHSGLDLRNNRTRRDVPCGDEEYLDNNICCRLCPAGTRVKSACIRSAERGQCEECDDGTFTEHANGLNRCFKCTRCRPDQEVVRQCTHTQDMECQCKVGKFCAPEEVCEVCKTCLQCGKDEEIMRNCTATSNTVCKKILSPPNSASANTAIIVPLVLFTAAALSGIICLCWWKHRATGLQGDGLKHGEQCTEDRKNGQTQRPSCTLLPWQMVGGQSSVATEDECRELCDSLISSASNSQHSLTSLPSSAFPSSSLQACPVVLVQPSERDNEFPKLRPVDGVESLKKCFDFFEELNVDYYKRFFRQLGITDNVIKSRENLLYEDRIHELLNIWVEKEGRDASMDDLLRALLALNQRRTAETIKQRAVDNGHFIPEDD